MKVRNPLESIWNQVRAPGVAARPNRISPTGGGNPVAVNAQARRSVEYLGTGLNDAKFIGNSRALRIFPEFVAASSNWSDVASISCDVPALSGSTRMDWSVALNQQNRRQGLTIKAHLELQLAAKESRGSSIHPHQIWAAGKYGPIWGCAYVAGALVYLQHSCSRILIPTLLQTLNGLGLTDGEVNHFRIVPQLSPRASRALSYLARTNSFLISHC